jgi:spermidine/putrescine transport system permease protein
MKTLRVVALVLYAFIYLPLIVVIGESFNASPFGLGWSGWTFQWYHSLLHNPNALAAVKVTFFLAICSTAIATFFGSLLGYGLARHGFRGKNLFEKLMLIPISVPDIVMAVSLLLFYALVRSFTGFLHLGFTTMLLAHVTFQIPFVALIVRARTRGFDPALEEAAYDLGASPWQRLWHVTLPLMRPGILAGALLALTLSLDDFVVSFFSSGPGTSTVPIYIYGSVKRGVTAEINALASLLIFAAILVTVALQFLRPRQGVRSSDIPERDPPGSVA